MLFLSRRYLKVIDTFRGSASSQNPNCVWLRMGPSSFGGFFCSPLLESVLTTFGATFFDPFPDGFGIDIHFHTSTRRDIDIDCAAAVRGAIHARTGAVDVHPHATPRRIDRNRRHGGATGSLSVFEIRLDDGRVDFDASTTVTAEEERGKGAGGDGHTCDFHDLSFEPSRK